MSKSRLGHNGYAIMGLRQYQYIDDVIINGVNPITGNYQPLTLNETFLKDINYKDNIVGGSYVFTGEEVNIIFMLSDGTKKEENIKLDKAEL